MVGIGTTTCLLPKRNQFPDSPDSSRMLTEGCSLERMATNYSGGTRPMENQFSDDEIRAYHEAGHTVVAYRLGLDLWYVTIDPENGVSAQTRFRSEKGIRSPDEMDVARHLLKCNLGGLTAVGILMDLPHKWDMGRDGDDLKKCMRICGTLGLTDAHAWPFLDQIQVDLHRYLSAEHNWRDVQAVAAELLRNRRLTYDEVAAILGEGPQP
jgi:hypothetical protein